MLWEWLDSLLDWTKLLLAYVFLRAKNTLATILTLSVVTLVLLWVAVFMYGTFYYAYMPVVAHVKDVNLQFSPECEFDPVGCPFPSANLSLMTSSQTELLTRGQVYVVLLELDIPESPINRDVGNFMVRLQMYSNHGKVVHQASRATMLHYKSTLLRWIETLVYGPFLLFGTREQMQLIEVQLFDKHQEDAYHPSLGAFLQILSKRVQIYSGRLKIHARFTGLRYVLYHWPLMSAVIGVGSNLFFLMVMALVSWYNFILTPQPDEVAPSSGRMKVDSAVLGKRRATVQSLLAREKERLRIDLLKEKAAKYTSSQPVNLTAAASTSQEYPAIDPEIDIWSLSPDAQREELLRSRGTSSRSADKSSEGQLRLRTVTS